MHKIRIRFGGSIGGQRGTQEAPGRRSKRAKDAQNGPTWSPSRPQTLPKRHPTPVEGNNIATLLNRRVFRLKGQLMKECKIKDDVLEKIMDDEIGKAWKYQWYVFHGVLAYFRQTRRICLVHAFHQIGTRVFGIVKNILVPFSGPVSRRKQ